MCVQLKNFTTYFFRPPYGKRNPLYTGHKDCHYSDSLYALCIHPFMCVYMFPSIHSSIHPAIHPPMLHPSVHLFVH